MPTISDLKGAAKELAAVCKRDCCPEYLFWLADNASKHPEDWGYPRSWAWRPNWTANDIRREISAVLWGLPSHPKCIAPVFRSLPFRTLSVIADGDIVSLWYDAPSSAIRHEWLASVAVNRRYGTTGEWRDWLEHPWRWYCRHCPIGDYNPRSRLIAEWLVAKKHWVGWHRPLQLGYDAEGQPRTVRPQDILDEVEDEDLVAGVKTSPERVFRRVLARREQNYLLALAKRNAPFPKIPWTLIPGVEQIVSERELVEEGRRMMHCVGTYAERCRRRDCFILRLPHSTVEVLPDGTVYQHRGYRNSEPPVDDKALLQKWLALRKYRGDL